MTRIRTIKPEFPQAESMGRVSREARYLFVLLLTQADDDGLGQATPRLLASFLYPYDDDARDLIEIWMVELEQVGSIRRYYVDGTPYYRVVNWHKHQKIDRPHKSRIPRPPDFDDDVTKPREDSSNIREQHVNHRDDSMQDLGPKDLGPETMEGDLDSSNSLSNLSIDEELKELAKPLDAAAELAKFRDHCAANGRRFKNARAAFRNWIRRGKDFKAGSTASLVTSQAQSPAEQWSAKVEAANRAYREKKRYLCPASVTDIRLMFESGEISEEVAKFNGYRPGSS